MDSVVKIQTLDSVDIGESQMLLKRWAEIELEKKMGQQSWRFIVRTGDKELKNVENVLNMGASKLLSGDQSLLTDSRGEPFSLSTVAPNTLLLVMYDEEHENAWESPWRLLEEIVKHEHSLIHFQIIYVGKYFGQLSQSFADRIMGCASHESEARLLLYKIQQLTSASYPHLLVTEVVLDEEGHKHFSKWKNIRDPDEFFLSKSKLYADLHKLTQPSVEAESNVKLLRALFADDAESTSSSVFVRSYTENIGVDQLYGKTVLLLISVMDEHPFQSLTEIYSKVKSSSDDLEILSIPIPVEVRGRPLHRSKRQLENMELPESDLAGFESILRNVPWPVLRNPWLLKIAVYYFIEREWGVLNPGILVVVNPNGRICSKNALPLVETWGSKVLPFSEEKMKQLEEMKQVEQESVEELLSECILDGLLEK
ncbi:hypothetical protein KI387_035334 [Taxus chinensis]|uniref:Uncharacterized protein n=1 Tax=Taxus chinensis TaxID=29808 RepID=A0AA38FQX4_TAXCH|nr:hypothetical protein KI387_035334 [Taxus chinensis]